MWTHIGPNIDQNEQQLTINRPRRKARKRKITKAKGSGNNLWQKVLGEIERKRAELLPRHENVQPLIQRLQILAEKNALSENNDHWFVTRNVQVRESTEKSQLED